MAASLQAIWSWRIRAWKDISAAREEVGVCSQRLREGDGGRQITDGPDPRRHRLSAIPGTRKHFGKQVEPIERDLRGARLVGRGSTTD